MRDSKIEEPITHTFSNELIEKCQELVYKRNKLHITDEQAERCLEKLARLANLAYKTLVVKEKI